MKAASRLCLALALLSAAACSSQAVDDGTTDDTETGGQEFTCDTPAADTALVRYHYVTSECVDACEATVDFGADCLVSSNFDGTITHAELTEAGQAELVKIAADLIGVDLAANYPCPEPDGFCDSVTIRLNRGGQTSDHTALIFGAGPPELQPARDFASAVLAATGSNCTASPFVVPPPHCQ